MIDKYKNILGRIRFLEEEALSKKKDFDSVEDIGISEEDIKNIEENNGL